MIPMTDAQAMLVEGVIGISDSFISEGMVLDAIEALEGMGIEPTVPTICIWLDGYAAGYDVAY